MIYERLDPGNPLNAELRPVTRAHMEGFGAAGLRTLCLASAVLDPDFYDECAHNARAGRSRAHASAEPGLHGHFNLSLLPGAPTQTLPGSRD